MWGQLTNLTSQLGQLVDVELDLKKQKGNSDRDEVYESDDDEAQVSEQDTHTGEDGSPRSAQNGRFRARLARVEAAAADALGELEDLREQLEEANKKRVLAEQKWTIAEKETNDAREDAARLRAEADSKVNSTDASDMKASSGDTSERALAEECAALKAKLNRGKRQFQILKKQLADATAEKEALLAEIQSSQGVGQNELGGASTIDELRSKITELEASKQVEITILRDEVASLRSTSVTTQTRLDQKTSEAEGFEAATAELEHCKKELFKAQGESRDINKKLAEAQRELQETLTALAASAATSSDAECELGTLRTKLEQAKVELQNNSATILVLEEKVRTGSGAIAAGEEGIPGDASGELEKIQTLMRELELELQTEKERATELQIDVGELRGVKDELDLQKKYVDELEQKLISKSLTQEQVETVRLTITITDAPTPPEQINLHLTLKTASPEDPEGVTAHLSESQASEDGIGAAQTLRREIEVLMKAREDDCLRYNAEKETLSSRLSEVIDASQTHKQQLTELASRAEADKSAAGNGLKELAHQLEIAQGRLKELERERQELSLCYQEQTQRLQKELNEATLQLAATRDSSQEKQTRELRAALEHASQAEKALAVLRREVSDRSDDSEKTIRTLEKLVEDSEADATRLAGELLGEKDVVLELRRQVSAESEQVAALNALLASKDIGLASLESKYGDAGAELEVLREQKDSLSTKVRELEIALEEVQEKLLRALEDMTSLASAGTKATATIAALRIELDTSKNDTQAVRAELAGIEELKDSLEDIQARHNELQESFVAQESLLHSQSDALASLTSELDQAKQESTERQKRFVIVQVGFNEQRTELEARLEAAEREVAEMRQIAEGASLSVAQVRKEAEEAERGRAASDARLDAHVAERSAQAEAIVELEGRLRISETRKEELERSLERAQEAAVIVQGKADESERILRDSAAADGLKLSSLSEECDTLRSEISTLKDKLDAAASVITDLRGIDTNLQLRLTSSGAAASSGGPSDPSMLASKLEVAEAAAATAARRLAVSEGEVTKLRESLENAEQLNKDLTWQVRMIADPSVSAGQSSLPGEGKRGANMAGILDVFGCAGNFDRRKGSR